MTRLRLLAASLVLLTALGGAALPPAGTTAAATARAGDQQTVDALIELAEPSLIERVLDEQAVAGRQLSAFAQRQHVQALQAAQAPIVAEAARYGAVYAQLTHTIDGVGVAGVNPGDLAALGRLPGVRAVHIVPDFTYELGTSVQFIGGQQALEQSGLDGRGTRIAIIDTGIDYTHRDFGGPGTPEAYALAKEKLAQAPPSYRGAALFPTAKLAGGFDYVGDAWTGRCPECAGQGIAEVVGPAPDPNPLDLAGHGTHVAGIAAGFGVPNSSVGGSIPAAFVRPGEAFSVFHGVATPTRSAPAPSTTATAWP